MLQFLIVSIVLSLALYARGKEVYTVEDVYVPNNCDKAAAVSDHLLIEYELVYHNGTVRASIKRPSQLLHIQLDDSEESHLHQALQGMCQNGTRKITWEEPANLNLEPILHFDNEISELEESVSFITTVVHITDNEDYQIFDAMHSGNISLVLDIIESHKGVNAVDEYGQTALMAAVSAQNIPIISGLLNTRRPKVDVNMAKSSGFTAIFYAVEKAPPSILSALLRRGADPNVKVAAEGSKGNTPLHYAALLERVKHAELLLEYGADPLAQNEYGMTPLQLLPRDAVPSTKRYFKKIFDDAFAKMSDQIKGPNSKSNEL